MTSQIVEDVLARAIEVQECGLNVVPSWRGIFAMNQGHEPFKDGFLIAQMTQTLIHDGCMATSWPNKITFISPIKLTKEALSFLL